MITAEELEGWVLHHADELLVIDKPGWVVCHPSKNGPWSSLVGACREWLQTEKLHLVARLDRETSGVVVLAKTPRMARLLQKALQARTVEKTYGVILNGEMPVGEPIRVDQPLARDRASPVVSKVMVRADRTARQAVSCIEPLVARNGHTVARVILETGRKHQIRAHAEWLRHRVVGDKIYGPDPQCFLDFIETGWTDALANQLLLHRQAIHCAEMAFRCPDGQVFTFEASWPADLAAFARQHMGLPALPEL
ncbi:MAG: RluA family pseudouridine synthase [Opitutales bacterium]